MKRASVVERAIDPGALIAEVQSPEFGAISLFVGTVRDVNDGRTVTALDYSAYVAMAESELAALLGDRSLQFSLPLLHAAAGIGVASQIRHSRLRGDRQRCGAAGTARSAPAAHHRRRADHQTAARAADRDAEIDSGNRRHLAVDEWRSFAGACRDSQSCRTRSPEHERRLAATRSYQGDRPPQHRLRYDRRGECRRARGAVSDQAQRR